MSFTSDVTVAVWVGYDNSRGKQTLGAGQTGSRVAIPIAEPIIEASWQFVAPKTPLPPPSAEAARHLKALPIDYASGQRLAASHNAFTEYFKLDANKRLRDTQFALAGRQSLARGALRPPRRTAPASAPAPDEQRAACRPRPATPARRDRRTGCRATLRELLGL